MRVRLKRDRLLELMAKSSLSQNHWAIKLGLSRGHWSDIVNGRHPYPSGKTRERILELFGIPFEELFEPEDGPGGADQRVKMAMSDRYIIDREIGHGGMGTVYQGRDVRLGRVVAVKIVSAEAVSGVGAAQFLQEIRRTAQLQHPNILPILDAGEADGQPYYVMPLVKDGSLRDRLDRLARLSVSETTALVRGVAQALQYAHGQHVLHCDVKPANVLLTGQHAFVADFGIARTIHAEVLEWGRPTALDTSAGTPAYVSPEQASGELHLDARSDVYSLACMVFEMLSGRPPFPGETTLAIVAQRFAGDPPDLRELAPELPARIATVVQHAMAVEVARRPADAMAFADALERGARHHVLALRERLGLAATRARTAVRRGLGRPGAAVAVTRWQRFTTKVGTMLRSLRNDVVYALRTFARAPVFALGVVLTLGFGIGANALVFSLMNPYFFRAVPFERPDELVQLGHASEARGYDKFRFSLPQYWDYRARARAFEDLGAYSYGGVTLGGEQGAERITVSGVSTNLFGLLGAAPAVGRVFLVDENAPGQDNVVVLDHRLWQRRYGGDPGILGKTVVMNDVSRTVVGVMSPDFVFPFGGVDAWYPIAEDRADAERSRMGIILVGRLRSGWTPDQAKGDLDALHAEFGVRHPEEDGLFDGVSVQPIRSALNFAWRILRPMFALLQAAVAFALVLVCVNVASLTLARSSARTGEVAVRTALGASRGRLVRQFLTESFLLTIAGGALGVLLAHWGATSLGPLIPEDWYRVGDASVDGNVLAFTAGVVALTVALFGLAPAMAGSRTDLSIALKEGGATGGGRRAMRARRYLVVFQVAMAVVLLSGLGMTLRSFAAVRRVDLGFAPDSVVIALGSTSEAAFPQVEDVEAYFDQAVAVLAGIPGVTAVGQATSLPQNHEVAEEPVAALGEGPVDLEDWPVAIANRVSGGFFEAMRISLVAGRTFETVDDTDGEAVTIVSAKLAERLWPDGNAVGRVLEFGDPHAPEHATVVGVVGDVHFDGLTSAGLPQVYRPVRQVPSRRRFLVVGAATARGELRNAVRQRMRDLNAGVPVSIMTFDDIIGQNMLPYRLGSIVLGVLGAAAVLLASLGIYGVVAYSVAQRGREIGVRMALGATAARVRRTVVTEGLRLSGLGIGIGLIASITAGVAARSVLFGVRGFDPITLVAVLTLFVAVTVLASLLPAVRASRVEPAEALRYE